ncbi:hypothetical protein [Effusibacillus lacus]|uniref:hypothetical protein n=1 Tax=Effusibacillus lacus TaxID=1348429 RepID=UPI0010DE372F|nr:hypothetical protein [Effusibacillus lacus]TCS74419.1 hypothetical protein EDD64_11318 [Effusibacillus lacus]
MLFFMGLLTFVVCLIIQYFSLHRVAFGRSMFITCAMFFVGFMISLSPYDISQLLSKLFYVLGWGFLLLVTWYAVVRRQKMKKLTNTKP